MTRSILSQHGHDELVMTAIQSLQYHGYNDIKADLSNYRSPEVIRWANRTDGHIPDITAYGNGSYHLFEIETVESINSEHTASQWKLFAAFAKEHNANFYIVVPTGNRYAVEVRLNALSITANIWEI